jgi:hypothetical protein
MVLVLRRIFGPKEDKVTGPWSKLYNEKHNLYCSPSIIRMIMSRRVRWGRRGIHVDIGGKARRKGTTMTTQT